jgi:hypothetical protein
MRQEYYHFTNECLSFCTNHYVEELNSAIEESFMTEHGNKIK